MYAELHAGRAEYYYQPAGFAGLRPASSPQQARTISDSTEFIIHEWKIFTGSTEFIIHEWKIFTILIVRPNDSLFANCEFNDVIGLLCFEELTNLNVVDDL